MAGTSPAMTSLQSSIDISNAAFFVDRALRLNV
jgi:hypothetical protein